MGRYSGKLVFEWLDDGRLMRLQNDIAFIDSKNLNWPVPAGAKVDGASIPKPLWSITGGPFEGRFRNASVIHDWYCDRRTRTSQSVHSMFYEAMLTSGVSKIRANIMYAAVRYAGPAWSDTAVENNNLSDMEFSARPRVKAFVQEADPEMFSSIVAIICQGKHSQADIDALVDKLAPRTGASATMFR